MNRRNEQAVVVFDSFAFIKGGKIIQIINNIYAQLPYVCSTTK